MRLDHIAYRVFGRIRQPNFSLIGLGYRILGDLPEGFKLKFDDGTTTNCLVLVPSEKTTKELPWNTVIPFGEISQTYHIPPEIFISDGANGSIVGEWVKSRDNVGGVHHIYVWISCATFN